MVVKAEQFLNLNANLSP